MHDVVIIAFVTTVPVKRRRRVAAVHRLKRNRTEPLLFREVSTQRKDVFHLFVLRSRTPSNTLLLPAVAIPRLLGAPATLDAAAGLLLRLARGGTGAVTGIGCLAGGGVSVAIVFAGATDAVVAKENPAVVLDERKRRGGRCRRPDWSPASAAEGDDVFVGLKRGWGGVAVDCCSFTTYRSAPFTSKRATTAAVVRDGGVEYDLSLRGMRDNTPVLERGGRGATVDCSSSYYRAPFVST